MLADDYVAERLSDYDSKIYQLYRHKNGQKASDLVEKVKNEMATLYANFECENRNDIIGHLVNPQKSTRVPKKEDIPENMLIHVYDPESSKLFENVFATLIVDRYKRAIGEEPNVAEKVGFYKYLDQGINEAVKKDLNRFKDKIDMFTKNIREG